MRRPIKFRVWSTQCSDGTMISLDRVIDLQEERSWRVMQFTGLQDRNGVDIFEGDIVRILYTDWPSQHLADGEKQTVSLEDYKDSLSNIGKVIFKDCEFCIQFNAAGYTSTIHCGRHGQITVIGNVHESRELLEVTP